MLALSTSVVVQVPEQQRAALINSRAVPGDGSGIREVGGLTVCSDREADVAGEVRVGDSRQHPSNLPRQDSHYCVGRKSARLRIPNSSLLIWRAASSSGIRIIVVFVAVLAACSMPRTDDAQVKANNLLLEAESAKIAAFEVGGSLGKRVGSLEHCQYDGSTAVGAPFVDLAWDPDESQANSALDDLERQLIRNGYVRGVGPHQTSVGGVPDVTTPSQMFVRTVDGMRLEIVLLQFNPNAEQMVSQRLSWAELVGNRVLASLSARPNGCGS